MEHVLKSIYCVRILTHTELLAMVNILPKFVEENPLIKLIIIDSVASPFRNEFTDLGLRNRLLNGMAQKLIKMASEKGLAVSEQEYNTYLLNGSSFNCLSVQLHPWMLSGKMNIQGCTNFFKIHINVCKCHMTMITSSCPLTSGGIDQSDDFAAGSEGGGATEDDPCTRGILGSRLHYKNSSV